MHKIRVTKKQFRILVLVYRIGGFLLVSGLLVGISVLMGKPFEFILIFAPYFVTKQLYARQYHATSLKQCLLLSLCIFSFLKEFDYEGLKTDYYAQMPILKICEKYHIARTTFYRLKNLLTLKSRPQIYKHKVRYYD